MTDAKQISQTCVLQHMRAAARRLTQIYETAFAPLDLTASQFTTMIALTQRGDFPISQLASVVGMDRTTMQRVLTPLERRGLVQLAPHKTDGRTRVVSLTDNGRVTIAQAQSLWDDAQTAALASLEPHAWDQMRPLIRALGQSSHDA